MQDDNLSVDGNIVVLFLLSLIIINMGRLGNSFWYEDDVKLKKQKLNRNDGEGSVSNEDEDDNMLDEGIIIINNFIIIYQ